MRCFIDSLTHNKIAINSGSNLENSVMLQSGTELLQRLEAKIWVARDSGSILVAIHWAWSNNGKGVIRGSNTSGLDLSPKYVINERRFSRGVVAHQ